MRIQIPDPQDRDDLRTLLRRYLSLDEVGVLRIVETAEGRLRLWGKTPFGVLITRTLSGNCESTDLVCAADQLLTALDILPSGDPQGLIDSGPSFASAWSGLVPPEGGFTVVETIPAQVMLDLAATGREVARESAGPLGLPPSLLDQGALTVGAETATPVRIDMRMIFALTGCGFIPERTGRAPEGEPVRISTQGQWVRIDARYGTVFRRPDSLPIGPQ